MALADYYLCDECSAKTFYDADVSYRDNNCCPETGDLWPDRVGWMRVLCVPCAEAARTAKPEDTQRSEASPPYPPEVLELIEAAELLRDDMVQRAEMNAHQNAGEVVVEASRGRWDRFQAALCALTGEEG